MRQQHLEFLLYHNNNNNNYPFRHCHDRPGSSLDLVPSYLLRKKNTERKKKQDRELCRYKSRVNSLSFPVIMKAKSVIVVVVVVVCKFPSRKRQQELLAPEGGSARLPEPAKSTQNRPREENSEQHTGEEGEDHLRSFALTSSNRWLTISANGPRV